MPSSRLLVSALLALALCGVPKIAAAESFSDAQRSDIEAIVRNYLISHPEVLEETMTELSKRQAAAEAMKHEASVTENADIIFNSPRGVVLGNKDGDVTFVEFFDYNCGYCKRAMADMLDLMKTDPKLKVVLKEFPVLSQGSVEAAQVAVAVRMQDPSGKKYLDFHQKLLGGRGPADKVHALAAAREAGLDVARIEKDISSPEVRATIEENFKLAEAMGMNGTPSYVIGKQVVIGAVGLDSLKEKIGLARCGKAACQANAEGRTGTTSTQTTGQAGAGAKLSTEQRTRITSVIREQHIAPVNEVNFAIAVGSLVPRERVTLHPLPAGVVSIYPQQRGYEFFLVRDQILVVDPRTFEIVAVLEA